MRAEPGQRVIRGPDWKSSNQDGGEGHVGTVTREGFSSLATAVNVLWDSGGRNMYRAGAESAYDLRVLDNAQSGAIHQDVACFACDEVGIAGMRWSCTECPNVNLCTQCYMTDKHNGEHVFVRIVRPMADGTRMPARKDSAKLLVWGIFPLAKVSHGPDWKWGATGGDSGNLGTVLEIKMWKTKSHRSAAMVKWKTSAISVYRCGHKGRVDLTCHTPASGGTCYCDHLPVLGRSSPVSAGHIPNIRPVKPVYKPGDKVTVRVQASVLRELQEGHGGWAAKMVECIGSVGTVCRLTDNGDVVVTFEADQWILNVQTLTKVEMKAGDAVYIINNLEKVKQLQKGHGGWIEPMKKALGKTGTLKMIDSDGDFRVHFKDDFWAFNPACCLPVAAGHGDMTTDGPTNTSDSDEGSDKEKDMDSMLQSLLQAFAHSFDPSHGSKLVQAAYNNNLEDVRSILRKKSESVDGTQNGKTALHLACYSGNVDMVVCLLTAEADPSVRDKDGFTPLHYAAYKNRPEVVKAMLERGAPVDPVNKSGQTPSFVAVQKQCPDCVSVLLTYQCDVNRQDSVGDTALYDAMRLEDRTIVDQLIACSSTKFSMKNHKGFGPLHHAALVGNAFAVQKILEKASNLVELKMEERWTALHIAAVNGHLECVQLLVTLGEADVNTKGRLNTTPLQLALAKDRHQVADFLKQHGAKKTSQGPGLAECPIS